MSALEFRDLGEHFDAGLLERAYRDVYLPAFPLPDEQEDPGIWEPRLRNPDGNPRLCFLVAGTRLDEPAQRAVQGLLVAEYYAASQCVLISYVAAHPDARGQGLARRLFDALGERIDAGRLSRGQPVQAVFAEVHDPAQNGPDDDVLDPNLRLRIMAKLGGQRVPVDYLQPPLGPDRQAADGLWLLAFPGMARGAPPLTAERIRRFLVEFYRELGSDAPEADPLYAATFASVDALTRRSAVLQPLVHSTLKLHQAAVALQFALTDAIPEAVRSCAAETEYCPHFHSYEKDLLSHAFRTPPPVRSYCVPHAAGDAEPAYVLAAHLRLPHRLRFRTEGETLERHRLGPATLPVSLSFNRSDFLQSGRSILNLVVHIDQRVSGTAFGEYELLCLGKLWGAPDESETWLVEDDDEGVWFEIGDARLRPHEVAARYLGAASDRPIGGCLQIVFSECGEQALACTVAEGPHAVTTRALIDALNAIQQEDAAPPERRLHPALNAVGCLLQNILDLENVDLNELEDMLDGVNTSRSAVTAIHRNTLFAITVNDRLFDDLADTLGMSPYLLLPQAALLHNERVLFEASALLRQTDGVADALRKPDTRDAIRQRLIDGLRSDPLDDLPGGPDRLIRATVGWLWKRYRRAEARARRCHAHEVDAFIAELDLSIAEGLSAHARARLSTLLDRDMLGNIFQYVSERWIFKEGSRDRGLNSLLGVLRKRADDLDTALAAAETRQSEWRNSNYAVIGLAFTLYTVIPFEGLIGQLPGATSGDALNPFGLLLLMATGLALVSVLLWRRVIVLIYMRALGHVARKLGPDELLPAPGS